jgi:hypothetical protein
MWAGLLSQLHHWPLKQKTTYNAVINDYKPIQHRQLQNILTTKTEKNKPSNKQQKRQNNRHN